MDGAPAVYLGTIVSKEHFRAFIYAPNGSQMLVESWEEFERKMESGMWFATIEDSKDSVNTIKSAEKLDEKVKEPEEIKAEVKKKDEDFLPKARK